MAKSRPDSPHSTITTTSTVKRGPDGRKYMTRVEKTKPKYSFKIETKTTTVSAIPEEVDLDVAHFKKKLGLIKIAQLIVAVLCMIFISPTLTWFSRLLCVVVSVCFAITIFVCLFYLFTLRRVVMPSWSWLKIEALYTNAAAVAYVISSLLHLIYTSQEEYRISLMHHGYFDYYIIAGAFGLVNFVLYALGGQLLHNRVKSQRLSQPRVCIIRTTLDRNGRAIKKTKERRIEKQPSRV